MDRSKFLKDLVSTEVWDIIIIGGGASGLGAAVDSAQRSPSAHDLANNVGSQYRLVFPATHAVREWPH